MKPVQFAYLGLGLALFTLAGCETPESKITAACTKNKMNVSGQPLIQPGRTPAQIKTYCECVTRTVKGSMTPAELKTFADRLSSSAPDAGDISKMPEAIGGKAIQATKTCA